MMEVIDESSPKDIMETQEEEKPHPFDGEETSSSKTNILGSGNHVSEEQMEGEDSTKDKDDKLGVPPHLSSSRWTNLARVFRLGLALEADISQNMSTADMNMVAPPSLTTIQKRGSLGKIFRQGFSSFSRPTSPDEESKPQTDAKEPMQTQEMPQQSKKGTIWRLFKHGKSSNFVNESNTNDVKEEGSKTLKEEGSKTYESKRSFIGRPLKHKSNSSKTSAEDNDGSSLQTQPLPPSHLRGRSLGKFFRHHKDLQLIDDTYVTSQERNLEYEGAVMTLSHEETGTNKIQEEAI